MVRHGLLALCATGALIAGCGGSSSSTKQASGGAHGCDRVKLGDQGSGTMYARVDHPTNVGCPTAQTVVREWGRQQVGLGTAHLPAGWKCDGSSTCRHGTESVTLSLVYP